MSSLRNAAPRRPHKERAQPAARAKWGLLEKHADYSARAADYNLKKRKLAQLSAKARARNPDEFAFGMHSAVSARQGRHGRGGTEGRLGHDVVKLIKGQDAGYLRVVAGRGRREVERLAEDVAMREGMKGTKRKMVYVDERQEDGEGEKDEGKYGGKDKGKDRGKDKGKDGGKDKGKDEGKKNVVPGGEAKFEGDKQTIVEENPKSKKALGAERQAVLDRRAEKRRRKRIAELRAAKLAALKKRQKEIMAATEQLELQRAKMSRTVGGVNKDGVRWKVRERKR